MSVECHLRRWTTNKFGQTFGQTFGVRSREGLSLETEIRGAATYFHVLRDQFNPERPVEYWWTKTPALPRFWLLVCIEGVEQWEPEEGGVRRGLCFTKQIKMFSEARGYRDFMP
jgi:hypothetical protein